MNKQAFLEGYMSKAADSFSGAEINKQTSAAGLSKRKPERDTLTFGEKIVAMPHAWREFGRPGAKIGLDAYNKSMKENPDDKDAAQRAAMWAYGKHKITPHVKKWFMPALALGGASWMALRGSGKGNAKAAPQMTPQQMQELRQKTKPYGSYSPGTQGGY